MFSILGAKPQESESATPLFSAPASERKRAEQVLMAALLKARKSGPFSERMRLTPALAELLLERNPENRRLSQRVVNRYATDIKEGNWTLNGEPVIVAETGDLNDGQHRCAAVVEAGKGIEVFLAFGVSRETRTTVDQGVKRTVDHYLHMGGHPNATGLAKAASLAWQFRKMGRITTNADARPTAAQVLEFVETNPDIHEAVTFGGRAYSAKLCNKGLYGAVHFTLSRINAKAAETFSETLIEGIGFAGRKDPIYVLRKRLIEGRRISTDAEAFAFCIKAWNAWRAGEAIGVLKFIDGEDFPKPR